MRKRCLILGITGQCGPYLAQHLLSLGYEVWGSSRDAETASLHNLEYLGIKNKCKIISIEPIDFHSVIAGIKQAEPDEIYHLAAQSSVGLSFSQPASSIEHIATGALNVLEAIRLYNAETKVYYASSSECFGYSKKPINEATPLNPLSPYGIGKSTASHAIRFYRETYGLFCVNGYLFNHESPLRSERFVTQKIIKTAYDIAMGREDSLILGDLTIKRDWGWVPEFVKAMHLMLQQDTPSDYVIATGMSYSLKELVDIAFSFFGLDYSKYVISDPKLFRPNELKENVGDPSKANDELSWRANVIMPDVVKKMCMSAENKWGRNNGV